MQNPAHEIASVISSIISSPTPDIQREAIRKYFTEDAGFRNPFCFIKRGTLSREDVLGVYQWYRILSSNVEPVQVESVIHDENQDTLVLDTQHNFHIRLSPFKPVPARLLTRLRLSKRGGLYYICYQEDFFHPDEIFNLLVPPVVPAIRLFLLTTGTLSTVFAKSAQVLGFWRTDKSGIKDLFPEQELPSISENSVDTGEMNEDKTNQVKDVKDDIQNVEPQPAGLTQGAGKAGTQKTNPGRVKDKSTQKHVRHVRTDQGVKANTQRHGGHAHSGTGMVV